MNYSKEELVLVNMKKINVHPYSLNQNSPKMFEIEKSMTVDEKIAFIDAQYNGTASYLIDLFTRWDNEKGELPKDAYGSPKTVSKKAWIRRSDTRAIINKDYGIGSYPLFGTGFKEMSLTCPTGKHGYSMPFTDAHVAEQWFHDLLKQLYIAEKKHFEANDPYTIKLETVKTLGRRFSTVFNNQELNDIIWNSHTDVSEVNLDIYINLYERLDVSIKALETELEKKLPNQTIE